MAYSNAIFYIDPTNGNDAVRTALTSCVAFNPSGGIVRIFKTSHGLINGAVVDLTSFDSLLNGSWKVSVVDADNFDLLDAVWSVAIIDNNGTVTPRGGSSWTDAWRTTGSGATSSRHQQGDTIRISKSPDPVSIGNATWTNLSRAVTLASAQTLTIDNCESGWVAANSATVGTSTTRKQGTVSVSVSRSTAWSANTLYAYKNLGTTLNLSSYDSITFWFFHNHFSTMTNWWRVALCSDTAGATVVDQFILPSMPSFSGLASGGWFPFTLTRVGGGNLGSSIRSIALYTHSTAPNNTSVFINLDNFSACSSTGLNLNSLISKNGSAFGGTESWYPIKNIDGTSIELDNSAEIGQGSGRGYYGVTETIASYSRQALRPFLLTNMNNFFQAAMAPTRSGISTSLRVYYTGGWNTATNLQDGDTYIDGTSSTGIGFWISGFSYIYIERLRMVRFEVGFRVSGTSNYNVLNDVSAIACRIFGVTTSGYGNILNFRDVNNNNDGFYSGPTSNGALAFADNKFTAVNVNNNSNVGIRCDSSTTSRASGLLLSASNASNNGTYAASFDNSSDNVITLSSALSNGTAAVFNSFGMNYLRNSTLAGTEFAGATTGHNSRVLSTNHDGTLYGWIYTDGGTINSQATTFSAGTGAEWRLNVTSSTRNFGYPLKLTAAQYAVNSGSAVRVDAVMKKSHATDVTGRLVIPGGQLAGIPNDVVATLSNNTNEQTLSLSCVPAQTGVIDVEVWAEYVNNTGIVYVDEITFKY